MSADKRSVTTDALATLGTIIEDGGRDAIHLAVEPIVAGEQLYPGQHIGIFEGKAYSKATVKKLGIVDPFINGFIPEGKKFWLIVYPRQITSLRHVWTHPDFDVPEINIEDTFESAQTWIRNWAEDHGLSYEQVISVADENAKGGYDSINMGQAEGLEVPEKFWDNYEIIRKTVVAAERRYSFFSC